MKNNKTRRFSTLCLSISLSLGLSDLALAGPNDAR